MIGILGFRRIVVLLVLAAIAGLVAAGVYLYLEPQNVAAEREMRSLKSQVAAKRNDIEKVRAELDKLTEQKDTFEELRKVGFFSQQDRLVAKDRIEEIQELSSVLAVRYRIRPAEIETNPLIRKAKHVVLASPFEITVDALDDSDIYRFIYLLQTSFPGHASFDSVNLKRGAQVDDASLRQILTDRPVALVNGNLKFTWRTILPEEQVSIQGDNR
ncbi:MAG: hypothetical protein EOM26_11035 [Alphaproteobacteria bacterium]|nr:hypothetical protein [Alphaproteobacteria bacterium]